MATTGVVGFHLTPPIWIGNTLPDRKDEVTLRELQTEVHRRSLAIGIRIRVLHSGVFIFDFSGWSENRDFPTQPKDWAEYDDAVSVVGPRVRIMNAYLACLYTSMQLEQDLYHEKMIVTPTNINPYPQFEPTPDGIDDLFVFGLTRRSAMGTFKLEVGTKLRHSYRDNITIATLDRSFDMLEMLLGRNSEDALLLPELLLRSREAYESFDYNRCLILAWAITERLFSSQLSRFRAANPNLGLKEPHNLRAAEIATLLSQHNEIPKNIYDASGVLRKARNNWIHGLSPVSREEAEGAVALAQETLTLIESLDLPARMQVQIFLG